MGTEALLEPNPKHAADLGEMQSFVTSIQAGRMPVMASVGIIDDGSKEVSEVLDLVSRRNLLYKIVPQPDPKLDLNIRIGSEQYPRDAVKSPNDFVARVRKRLSDRKRLLRIYCTYTGTYTYTVLANLTGENGRARVHLVNYARRPATDVRVRVPGVYHRVELSDFAEANAQAADITVSEGGTEFTVPRLTTYAVVDLE